MSSQSGDVAAKLLLLLVVVAIAGAVASPWLLRSPRTGSEHAAIATLKQIHAAQAEQYGASRMYADIDRLKASKRLPANFRGDAFAIDEYRYRHQAAGGWQRWCAEATPLEEKTGAVLAIDETGIVKEFPAGFEPCSNGELTSPGTPVR